MKVTIDIDKIKDAETKKMLKKLLDKISASDYDDDNAFKDIFGYQRP